MPDAIAASTIEVRLSIPATTELVRLARLNAAGLATSHGWGVDAVDDLRLAINEACALLTDPEGDDHIDLVFRSSDDRLMIEGRRASLTSIEVDDLVTTILSALVDDHEFTADGDGVRFVLTKSAGG